MSVAKNMLLMNIQVSKKLNKIDYCSYQIVLFAVRKKSNFIKNKEYLMISLRIQKFRETGNLNNLYRNELDKACFAHKAVYS